MFLDAPFDVSASYPSSSSSLSATNVSGLFGQSNPLKATASRTPVHKRMSSSSSPDGNNHGDGGGGSEGYASRQSHHRRQCLCGNVLVNDELEGEEEDGMYCSVGEFPSRQPGSYRLFIRDRRTNASQISTRFFFFFFIQPAHAPMPSPRFAFTSSPSCTRPPRHHLRQAPSTP